MLPARNDYATRLIALFNKYSMAIRVHCSQSTSERQNIELLLDDEPRPMRGEKV